jgi:hypothetical protein
MTELFQAMVVGPVLPATILLGVLMVWSLLTITVGVGLDLQTPLHGHFESVSHAFWDAIGSVAMVPMKWLNLRNMPFMLWIGIFAIVWWCTSIGFWMVIDDRFVSEPNASPVGSYFTVSQLYLPEKVTSVANNNRKSHQ